MYEPYNKLKFGQFASYYDQMRAAVKYVAENKGRNAFCVTYQDFRLREGCPRRAFVAETKALGPQGCRYDRAPPNRHRFQRADDQTSRCRL